MNKYKITIVCEACHELLDSQVINETCIAPNGTVKGNWVELRVGFHWTVCKRKLEKKHEKAGKKA